MIKSSKRKKRFPVAAVLLAAALIAAVFLFLERMEPPDDAVPRKPGRTEPRAKAVKPKTRVKQTREAEPGGQRVAVLIDDIGFDLGAAEELARLRAPIAFAILPHAPHAAAAADLLHAAGKEILLHLPMEPASYPEENPGPGALLIAMEAGEVRRKIAENLAAVPHVSGVNNHMGSRFMEDETRLRVVMDELAKRGLFFVDSRTTPDSRGREAAERARVRFASRTVFIDHTANYQDALANLTRFPRQGSKPVLMIGHPRPETIRALRDALPVWHAQGVRVVPVSACLGMNGG